MTRWTRWNPAALRMLRIACAVLASVTIAGASEGDGAASGAERRSSLVLRSPGGGDTVEAPLLETEVRIAVQGPLARVRVVQRFANPSSIWMEGVYVFPLPEGAAVDRLRMAVGDRIIEGRIEERAAARAVYEEAARDGRRASLVEQERPNVFITSVANVGPGDEVMVAIEYQETVRFAGGAFEIRFPMVVGPRYVPGAGSRGGGTSAVIDDATRITPTVTAEEKIRVNPVRLSVDLDPGLRLARIVSPSHAVDIVAGEGRAMLVTLADEEVYADRDFVLTWEPEVGAVPEAAVFVEEFEGEAYVVLMVVPPRPEVAATVRLPREAVFVVDTSGSMHGASMDQAKAALEFALDRLEPDDEFNLIQFNSRTSSLFTASRQAFPAALEEAREWVRSLEADGGTEMLPALEAALADRPSTSVLRQVVFITDGCVSNEQQLFATIRARLGRSRLFTVGIGSAPNAHFMERSARHGRGTFTYIGSPEEVEPNMRELFANIDTPVVTDIEVVWPDSRAELYPLPIPDLYGAEPLVVAVRMATVGGEVVVTGVRGLEPWLVRLPLAAGADRGGIHRLWARRKLAAVMDRLAEGATLEEVRADVVPVALRHHLISRFTSLVAVDVTPARPEGEGMASRPVPANLPAGWSAAKVLGQLPQGGTDGRLRVALGLILLGLGVVLRGLLGGRG